jgi:hypothetical protein
MKLPQFLVLAEAVDQRRAMLKRDVQNVILAKCQMLKQQQLVVDHVQNGLDGPLID